MSNAFDYAAFTTRNIGFVSETEQRLIKSAKVFICGTGGMGGAALMALARAGLGHVIIADLDAFEVSNLNRLSTPTRRRFPPFMSRARASRCRKSGSDTRRSAKLGMP